MEAPARGASSPAKDDQALGWDDEELETSIFDKPVGADTPEARANGGFLGPDDKTVAVPLSEATLAEMNEGFPAPSTFSDKVPTHKENQPAPLRQTVMGMGQTPPVRPLPLPPPTRPPAPAKTGPLPGPPRAPRPAMAPLAPARPQVPAAAGAAAVCTPGGSACARAASSGGATPDAAGRGRTQRAPSRGFSPAMPVPPSFFPPPPLSGFDQGPAGYPSAGNVRPALWLAGATLVGRHGPPQRRLRPPCPCGRRHGSSTICFSLRLWRWAVAEPIST